MTLNTNNQSFSLSLNLMSVFHTRNTLYNESAESYYQATHTLGKTNLRWWRVVWSVAQLEYQHLLSQRSDKAA